MMELMQTDIDYQFGMATGSLQLFSDNLKREKQISITSPVVGFQSLTADELKQIEPNLRSGIGGAIRNEMDRSGDIRDYCFALKKRAIELGVTFHMNSKVISWTLDNDKNKKKIKSLLVSSSENENTTVSIQADYYVIASGNAINDMSLEIDDIIISWPMRGYAIDAPISSLYSTSSTSMPLVSHILADDIKKVYISPLNSKFLRISGIVDMSARNSHLPQSTPQQPLNPLQMKRALQLLASASEIMPPNYLLDSCDLSYRFHSCLRPQTMDDLPVIGKSLTLSNVYYNGGHGHLGYTRATGSSKLLVELMKMNLHGEEGSGSVFIPQFDETSHLSPVNLNDFSPQRCTNLFLKIWRNLSKRF